MSEFKGTPGTWVVDYHDSGAVWNIDDSNGDSVALAAQRSTLKKDLKQKERRANAQIIAAAPELLFALQELFQLVDRTAYSNQIGESLDRASAAIAKALGQ